jgi:hypothetical protein
VKKLSKQAEKKIKAGVHTPSHSAEEVRGRQD